MSLARRAASGILRGAVRLAPAASRGWGSAMLAELDHVDGDVAALRWALGGSSALCRHALAHGRALRRVALGGALLALALLLFASSRGMSVSESRPAPVHSADRPRRP